MTYVKELLPNGKSPFQNYQWPLPSAKGPGAWVEADTSQPLLECGNGLHAYTEAQAQSNLRHDRAYWEIEYAEPPKDWRDKVSGYKARLVQPYPLPAWVTSTQPAIDAMKEMLWFQADGRPDPTWRLFKTRAAADDAARAAARAAASDAAWAAADDAARAAARAAAWAAARAAAWAAAWAAARDAANDAARAAARDAARAAAWAAAWDAALYVVLQTTCVDLPIEQKHRDHAEARMNGWRKGYGVLCDVDGILYVYERID